MPNTTSFDFADVVLVPFPFTDQSTIKKAPRRRHQFQRVPSATAGPDDRAALCKALDEILGP
jgi:hypothetical protein